MKMKYETRYLVTECVSVPVSRQPLKGNMYQYTTRPGWGTVEVYSATDNYETPRSKDANDTTQKMLGCPDTSTTFYTFSGYSYTVAEGDEMVYAEVPKQAHTCLIIVSDPCGYTFWTQKDEYLQIFVTYDENGLIDSYRLASWIDSPYDGEVAIAFPDLQSEEDYQNIRRDTIVGTLEYNRKLLSTTPQGETTL